MGDGGKIRVRARVAAREDRVEGLSLAPIMPPSAETAEQRIG